ncbi:Glycosyltransferase involved in cell wall bisynthesis [Belliella buryatensis]|uniref:Glycosyltransferase involved in cell wall bisynthesis n=1 Tax=Belliella buryatensis TaxID=1500549 RepID=A0A239CUH1_9BACT|nr:glycosyltransferase family 2 protein [Belliella buryatensis]SNS23760.1 Glycosyltransferase involved in cell wall bisynthesis [Belliella buryatensis]
MISVIIPTYKDDERLSKCLQALENQTLGKSEFEVIIVNNCPSESLDIDFTKIKTLNVRCFSEAIPGSYAARNKGILESKRDILAFTDSDCLPEPNWLKVAHSFLGSNSLQNTGILTGPVRLFYHDPKRLSPAEIYEKYTAFHTEAYAKQGFAVTANWVSYKSVIQKFGGFNAKLKSNGDSELSGIISKHHKIIYIPDLIVNHPARYKTEDLIQKYKRRIGGTYNRLYEGRNLNFAMYILNFIYRRYRFALKKLFMVSPKESIKLLYVCHVINMGAIKEYFSLIKGGDSKRL